MPNDSNQVAFLQHLYLLRMREVHWGSIYLSLEIPKLKYLFFWFLFFYAHLHALNLILTPAAVNVSFRFLNHISSVGCDGSSFLFSFFLLLLEF